MKNVTLSVSGLSVSSGYPAAELERKTEQFSSTELAKNRFQGVLGQSAKRNMRRKLIAWDLALEEHNQCVSSDLDFQQRNFGFLTLTIPVRQIHTHKEIKRKMLNTFLIWLKRKYPDIGYFWKAELHKTGIIHFHILVDCFVPWVDIREQWNKILDINGYINLYRDSMVSKGCNVYERYKELYGKCYDKDKKLMIPKEEAKVFAAWRKNIEKNWSDPNSIDIHALDNIDNTLAYVCKYVMKPVICNEIIEENDSLLLEDFGRCYGFSDNLSILPDVVASVSVKDAEIIEELIKNATIKVIREDFFTFYQIDFKQYKAIRRLIVDNFFTQSFNLLTKSKRQWKK